MHRSKEVWKLRVTAFCEGNSPMTGEFPTQRASDAKMFPFDDVIMLGALHISDSTSIPFSEVW